jgi:hypothetical protein
MIMDLIQFIKEYRSFRQKIGEELGVKEDELVLKFFMAFKRLHRANNSAFLNNLFDAMNPYINKSSNPDSDDNDDDPFSNSSNYYHPFR